MPARLVARIVSRARVVMSRRDWLVPASLVALSLVPSIAGTVRLSEIVAGGPVSEADARFIAMPVPVVLHILAAIPFGILGALQFPVALRTRGSRWHRIAGRVLLPAGVIVALSGLWMTQYHPWTVLDRMAVYVERLLAGAWMLTALVAATEAIRRRDFRSHGDWMTRAYAVALGAGTQVFTHLPWFLLVGELTVGARAVLMGAGWVINIVVAEYVIRRRRVGGVRAMRLAGAQA